MPYLARLSLLLLFSVAVAGCCCPPPSCVREVIEEPAVVDAPAVVEAVPDEGPPAPPPYPLQAMKKKRVKGLVWEEMTLDQAVTYLRTITGFQFAISPKVRAEKFDDMLINAQLDDVDVLTVLEVVLTQPFGLRHEVREGVVWILTADELDGPLRLRYYDVRDLTADAEPGHARHLDTLVLDLQREVAPSSWERKGAVVEGRNGILIVRASTGVHERIAAYLAKRRNAARPHEPIPAALRAKLEATIVNVAVTDQTLGDVVKVLMMQTGRNLLIDDRVRHEIAAAPTTLRIEDASLVTVLTMLASAAGEDYLWTAKGGLLVLTRREFFESD